MVQPPPPPPQTPWSNVNPQHYNMFKRVAYSVLVIYIAFWYFPAFLSYYFGGGVGRADGDSTTIGSTELDLSGSVKVMNRMAFESLVKQAAVNGTRVASLGKETDLVQRDIISYYGSSAYMQPVKLAAPFSTVVLGGSMLYITFDSDAEVSKCFVVGQGHRDAGLDIAAGKYFTRVPLTAVAVEFVVFIRSLPAQALVMPGSPSPGSDKIPAYVLALKRKCNQ